MVLDTDMMLAENVVLFSQGFMNVALCSTGVLTLSLVLNQVISTVVCLFQHLLNYFSGFLF